MKALRTGLAILTVWLSGAAHADELNIAVAANFLGTLQKLAPAFEKSSGHTLVLSGGSSGQFYQQIVQGAPFDIFLSADSERPRKLEEQGLAVAGSRFTYAVGKLVLWSPQPQVVDDRGEVLKRGDYRFIAVANPVNAPYGAAAREVLEQLDLWEKLTAGKKIVTGESIGQTLQFITSGNARLGFVALAQVIDDSGRIRGSVWPVPQDLYQRIDQDAVVLQRSQKRAAATAFLQWLRNDEQALRIIAAAGYGH